MRLLSHDERPEVSLRTEGESGARSEESVGNHERPEVSLRTEGENGARSEESLGQESTT